MNDLLKVVGEPVAWIKPDWLSGVYRGALSPVTTYPQNGFEPLYTEAQLLAAYRKGTEDSQDAKRWRYTQQDRYFQTGPYDTDGDFHGYSVGVEPLIPTGIHWKERAKFGGLNRWIRGRGDTLEEAIDEAIRALPIEGEQGE